MFLTYEGMINKLKNNSEHKIKCGIYSIYQGNVLLYTCIFIFFLTIITTVLKAPSWLFFLLYWGTVLVAIITSISRKCSLGLSENSLTYIAFTHLGYNIAKVYEIPFEKIKSITYHKFLLFNHVRIVFRDNRNKVREIKLFYSNILFRISFAEQKKSANVISTKLVELQKVLDKGDF